VGKLLETSTADWLSDEVITRTGHSDLIRAIIESGESATQIGSIIKNIISRNAKVVMQNL